MHPRIPSLLILLTALLLPSLAGAARVVLVPDGEPEAAWIELVATAERWAGSAAGTIAIADFGWGWVLVTVDPSGREHQVEIVPPNDDEGRMEVAMLAVSLLQPPRQRGPVRRAPPAEVASAPPSAAPAALPVERADPPEAAEVESRGAFPASLGAFFSATGALEFRDSGVGGGAMVLETGVGLPAGLRVGLRIGLDGDFAEPPQSSYPASRLPPLHLTVGGAVSWSADVPVSPVVGVGGGVRWTVARSPDALLGRRAMSPQLDVLLGLSLNPPGWLRFEPIALMRIGADVDLVDGPVSSAPLDVSVLGGLQVTLISPSHHPAPVNRPGR